MNTKFAYLLSPDFLFSPSPDFVYTKETSTACNVAQLIAPTEDCLRICYYPSAKKKTEFCFILNNHFSKMNITLRKYKYSKKKRKNHSNRKVQQMHKSAGASVTDSQTHGEQKNYLHLACIRSNTI